MSFHVVVVTGLSGAGRSTALHVLEDLGYYCVDNLPPSLVEPVVTLASSSERKVRRLGFGIDVRTAAFSEGTEAMLESIRAAGHSLDVLFLDCADEILVRRYSESRRPHPLASRGDVPAGVQLERERLATLRAAASHVVDTSEMSIHDLKRTLLDWIAQGDSAWKMRVRVVSFGFKYGLPMDADLVFDLRHLPNPHHDPVLRPQTGLDTPVSSYVLGQPATVELLDDVERFLLHALPRYSEEGKAYLTVAIGCTGGRHRSVAVAEEIARRLGDERDVAVHHRDVQRGGPRP
ncbi:MAG: RNase adapter RapZ [Sandaracinus sp.]|nr:RNase adapter RapZ [Sandaracinus sp.]